MYVHTSYRTKSLTLRDKYLFFTYLIINGFHWDEKTDTFRATHLSNDQKPGSFLYNYWGWHPTQLFRDYFIIYSKDRYEPIRISWFMSDWCFFVHWFFLFIGYIYIYIYYVSFTAHPRNSCRFLKPLSPSHRGVHCPSGHVMLPLSWSFSRRLSS